MGQTIEKVEQEAGRRVKEDGFTRIVYMTVGASFGICLIEEFEDRPILDQCVSIVWPDRIEVIKNQ